MVEREKREDSEREGSLKMPHALLFLCRSLLLPIEINYCSSLRMPSSMMTGWSVGQVYSYIDF